MTIKQCSQFHSIAHNVPIHVILNKFLSFQGQVLVPFWRTILKSNLKMFDYTHNYQVTILPLGTFYLACQYCSMQYQVLAKFTYTFYSLSKLYIIFSYYVHSFDKNYTTPSLLEILIPGTRSLHVMCSTMPIQCYSVFTSLFPWVLYNFLVLQAF